MIQIQVVFEARFKRSDLFGYVDKLPDFSSKTLTVFQDEEMTQATIVRTQQVNYFNTLNLKVLKNDYRT